VLERPARQVNCARQLYKVKGSNPDGPICLQETVSQRKFITSSMGTDKSADSPDRNVGQIEQII
jgi:hypothetical protein